MSYLSLNQSIYVFIIIIIVIVVAVELRALLLAGSLAYLPVCLVLST